MTRNTWLLRISLVWLAFLLIASVYVLGLY